MDSFIVLVLVKRGDRQLTDQPAPHSDGPIIVL